MISIAFLIFFVCLLIKKIRYNHKSLFQHDQVEHSDFGYSFLLYSCIILFVAIIAQIIYELPLEVFCILFVIITHFSFKSKQIIKQKVVKLIDSYLTEKDEIV